MTKKIDINGTVYVPMDLIDANVPHGISRYKAFEKFGVLHHGIKEIVRPSLFRKGYVIITVLVPETKYVDFYQAHLEALNPKLSLIKTILLANKVLFEFEKCMKEIKTINKK